MEWLITAGVVLVLAVTLPRMIRAANRGVRKRGRLAGATMMIGMAFMVLLDPAKAAALETIEKKKAAPRAGEAEGAEPRD